MARTRRSKGAARWPAGWIADLAARGGDTLAAWVARLHYDGSPADHQERELKAECAARAVARARLQNAPGVVFSHAPPLPDDDQFYKAIDRGTPARWSGRWYSREPARAASAR